MPVTPDIWLVRHPLKVRGVITTTCMTVIRLPNGELWLHSPVPMDVTLRSQLVSLGKVRHLVAPNLNHHLFALAGLAAWPQATLHVAPGLVAAHPAFAGCPELQTSRLAPWRHVIDSVTIEGNPAQSETVFFHRPSGTLVVSDLLTWQGPWDAWPVRWWARWQGCFGRAAVPRSLRGRYLDPQAARQSLQTVLGWDIRRIILAHGPVLEKQARQVLAEAFTWLPKA